MPCTFIHIVIFCLATFYCASCELLWRFTMQQPNRLFSVMSHLVVDHINYWGGSQCGIPIVKFGCTVEHSYKSFVVIHDCTNKSQYHDLYPHLVVNEVLSYLLNCVKTILHMIFLLYVCLCSLIIYLFSSPCLLWWQMSQ